MGPRRMSQLLLLLTLLSVLLSQALAGPLLEEEVEKMLLEEANELNKDSFKRNADMSANGVTENDSIDISEDQAPAKRNAEKPGADDGEDLSLGKLAKTFLKYLRKKISNVESRIQ